jgi:histone acetyltransferase (RNA polymerase elongator complex component)
MPTPVQVSKLILKHLETIDREQTIVEVAFFGGSFTGIPIEEQRAFLEVASCFLKEGLIDGIRLSTRPDYINEEILRFLKSYGVTTIELGVQSLNARVLKVSKRGHKIEDVIRASNLIKYYQFELGLQMMVGLPGDRFKSTYETAEKIISLKPDCVRIYPTIVFQNTELNQMFQEGHYKPLSLEDAIEYTSDILQLLYANNINVIRIGLQPTSDLLEGSEIVAGPFHPAFRQLVEARMYRNSLEENLGYGTRKSIEISINPKDYSNVVGHKRENIAYLEKQMAIEKIVVTENQNLMRFTYEIINDCLTQQYTVY